MTVWIVEPRDPLIVRDGRPFGPVPGARAVSLPFPFPSTVAGGVRTREGLDASGFFPPSAVARVKQVRVRGPLLVELDTTGEIAEWFAPAPSDALVLDLDERSRKAALLKTLVPLQTPPGAATDLPEGLALVGLPRPDPRKPSGDAPRYWRWPFFERWLLGPKDQEVEFAQMGHHGPVREARMHVGIRPETQTADEEAGALFQTRGLEFWHLPAGQGLGAARRLALAMATEATALKPGVAPLGGERRLVFWRPSSRNLPSPPEKLAAEIAARRCCRLILLTPACFRAGWKPQWLTEQRDGVKPRLAALALRSPVVVSGWSLENAKAKPTRRLAPAGTVFFLRLEGDAAAVGRWVNSTWLQCISDEEQDRRDGFGLAVLGAWDGILRPLEVD